MSFGQPKRDFLVPDGYSHEFARALYEHRNGNKEYSIIKELRTRFGTEKFFVESVETIYEFNEWKLDIKTKKDLRKIFKEG